MPRRFYTDIAEQFSAYSFQTIARLSLLRATEKLWQDPRGGA